MIKRCWQVVGDFKDEKRFKKCIREILASGCLDLSKCEDDFFHAYSILGALFLRAANQCLNGSAYENIRRQQKRESRNIMYFIPTWFN